MSDVTRIQDCEYAVIYCSSQQLIQAGDHEISDINKAKDGFDLFAKLCYINDIAPLYNKYSFQEYLMKINSNLLELIVHV